LLLLLKNDLHPEQIPVEAKRAVEVADGDPGMEK
jgi:hypothetical protein